MAGSSEEASCKHPDLPLQGVRFLPLEVTDAIHGIAVAHSEYPLCRYEAINHASGAAVAALVVRATIGYLIQLRDACDVARGELLLEETFTMEKLAEHHQLLSSLEYKWRLLIRQDLSSDVESSDVLLILFRKIPTGEAILARLYEFHVTFETEILQPIANFAKHKARKGHETEIRTFIRKLAFKLDALRYGVEKSISRTKKALQNIERDLNRDVNQVWRDSTCQPAQSRRYGSPGGDKVQIDNNTTD